MTEYGTVVNTYTNIRNMLYKDNTLGLKIRTPDGYMPFKGVAFMGVKPVMKLIFSNKAFIECTDDHPIYVNYTEKREAKDLLIGDEVFTLGGTATLISTAYTGENSKVYDVIGVDGGNKFYGNGILVSNCEFITFEETLINSVKLAQLESSQPIRKTGQVRWYKDIDPGKTYVTALDPSMGTGGDNAAIQVIELPTLIQVAEWSSNRSPIEVQVKTLKDILKEIQSFNNPESYWSVESNSLGEAALVVIRDTGEENFPGTMLHDPKNRLQGKTGRRAGFVTTNKSKLETCAKLKFLVESMKLKLNSKGIISELKVFVSRGNTYEARTGQTDDLVMAMVLALRMVDYISSWDSDTHGAINSNVITEDEEAYESPMPFFI